MQTEKNKNESIFQVPADICKVSSMAHNSLRLNIDTEENLSPDIMAKLMRLLNTRGWFTFSVEEIEPNIIANLPKLTFEKDEKSPATRLRNSLYVLWEQKEKPTETFTEFYNIQMERIINNVKDNLN